MLDKKSVVDETRPQTEGSGFKECLRKAKKITPEDEDLYKCIIRTMSHVN